MAAKVAKGSMRKQKPVATKTSLNSPFEKSWKPVVGDDMQFILRALVERFQELGLKKIEPESRPKKRKGAKRQKKCPKGSTTASELEEESVKEATGEETKSGWTHGDVRKQLAIGINEVTKALEKKEPILVLVCKSAKPEMITKHLIDLSITREVPTCQVPRLSETVAGALGLRSVLALGFRESSVFNREVKAIIPRVPPLTVPWLPSGSKKVAKASGPAPEEEEEEAAAEEDQEIKVVKPKPGQKRKLKVKEDDDSSSATFQSLKVKKIVPNPNKVRKVKKAAKKKAL